MVYECSRYYEKAPAGSKFPKMGKCKLTGGYCDSESTCNHCNVPVIRAIAGRGGTQAAQTIVRSWALENMEKGGVVR